MTELTLDELVECNYTERGVKCTHCALFRIGDDPICGNHACKVSIFAYPPRRYAKFQEEADRQLKEHQDDCGLPACPSCGSTEPDCLDECEVRKEIRESDREEISNGPY